MKKRGFIPLLFVIILVLTVNVWTYRSVLNGSGIALNLIKKLDFAYVTPRTYINLIRNFQKKPSYSLKNIKQIDSIISDKSETFIEAAFERDSQIIDSMLDNSAEYIKSPDGSSFIRHIGNDIHVEGYMATDKKLIKTKQRWHVIEDDETVTCSMEVYIEGAKSPQLWYLHFRKTNNDWKLFMLENDV